MERVVAAWRGAAAAACAPVTPPTRPPPPASSLSTRLRSIPAAESESRALFGLDPAHLAELALRDASRARELAPGWPRAAARAGAALHLLERYRDARAAFLDALELELSFKDAAAGLAAVDAALGGPGACAAVASSRAAASLTAAALDDFDCPVCSRLLYDPVTTPCGHTFCRACFARARDHGASRCALCRQVMHVSRDAPGTVAMAALLERCFPEEYAARAEEDAAERAGASPRAADPALSPAATPPEPPIPLFVMATLLPGEHMALNIFEPRYRLMVRRVMEGSRRFGMASVDAAGSLRPVACEAEVVECQPQPDGRFYLEIVGRRRFRVAAAWEADGYRVATPSFFADDPPADAAAAAATASLAARVEAVADVWVERIKRAAASRSDVRVLDLLQRAGGKPPPGAHEALSFWVANLVPTGGDRAWAATETCTSARLERQLADLGALGAPDAAGCCVM